MFIIMEFSMLPILLLIQMIVLFRAISRVESAGDISSSQKGQLSLILWALIFWAAISSYLGFNATLQKKVF